MNDAPSGDALMWNVFNQFHYLCDTHRYQKLLARADLVRRLADVPGDIVDCGTFKGVSTLQFAHFLQIYRPHGAGRVVSFDTFEARFPRVRPDEVASAADHIVARQSSIVGSIGVLVQFPDVTGLMDKIDARSEFDG